MIPGSGHRIAFRSIASLNCQEVTDLRHLFSSTSSAPQSFTSRTEYTPEDWAERLLTSSEDAQIRESVSVCMARRSPALTYFSLPNAIVMPVSGLVLLSDGTEILDISATGVTSEDLTRLGEIARQPGFGLDDDGTLRFDPTALDHAPRIARPVLYSFHAGSGTYGHWFFDCMPPVADARTALAETGAAILAPPLVSWQRDTVAGLGCGDRLAEHPELFVRCDRLIVPSFISIRNTRACGPVTVDAMRAVRDGAADPGTERRTGRIFYLSRRRVSARRKMVNEEELENALRERGVEVLFPEQMPLGDQVKAFAEADLVIAAAGSGNTNIGFSRPGTTLLEISIDEYIDPVFARLALVAGCRYAAYRETGLFYDYALARRLGAAGAHQSFSYQVDIARLLRLIADLTGNEAFRSFSPPSANLHPPEDLAEAGRVVLLGLGPNRYEVRQITSAAPLHFGKQLWTGSFRTFVTPPYEPLFDAAPPLVMVEARQSIGALCLHLADLAGWLNKGTTVALRPINLAMSEAEAELHRDTADRLAELLCMIPGHPLALSKTRSSLSVACRPGFVVSELALLRLGLEADILVPGPDLAGFTQREGSAESADPRAPTVDIAFQPDVFSQACEYDDLFGLAAMEFSEAARDLIAFDPSHPSVGIHPVDAATDLLGLTSGTTIVTFRNVDSGRALGLTTMLVHGHLEVEPIRFAVRVRSSRSGRLLASRVRLVAPGQQASLAIAFTPEPDDAIDVELLTGLGPGAKSSRFAWARFFHPRVVRGLRMAEA